MSEAEEPIRTHPVGLRHAILSPSGVLLCADDGTWEVEIEEVHVLLSKLPEFVEGEIVRGTEPMRLEVMPLMSPWENHLKQASAVIMHPDAMADFEAFAKAHGHTHEPN